MGGGGDFRKRNNFFRISGWRPRYESRLRGNSRCLTLFTFLYPFLLPGRVLLFLSCHSCCNVVAAVWGWSVRSFACWKVTLVHCNTGQCSLRGRRSATKLIWPTSQDAVTATAKIEKATYFQTKHHWLSSQSLSILLTLMWEYNCVKMQVGM